ncbi:SRPBCC family protein [Leptospira sp. 201903070]|jgi:carbon monoxide dehydrogenase subunit G|uniref:SRPBCC family protein n=1 Tax=Leptospira ainlahdjerensis TaxID=2810033 RepID=A0ABS2U654_9LEPT|nr:SRPBCC family protein [Leptospira ainlahdjerensis]MBM9575861.1 SRPBCC family protein [Leptospira ainlahdjerensis]
MSMLKLILLSIAGLLIVVIAILLLIASMKPDDFRYQRSISIQASPEKIFPLINDFHTWAQWSPWEKVDPSMKRTYGGPVNGVGTIYEWDGDKNIGKGRMEITNSIPSSKITIQLDFMAPFEAHNTAEFTLEKKGDSTQVTWVMFGKNQLISKIMSIFLNMDEMIGKQFETGLNNLKTIGERK